MFAVVIYPTIYFYIFSFQVCQNLQNKKREVFDMHGKRIEGTIAAEYKGKVIEVDKGKKENNSEWRKQHEEMITAIRQAKKNAPPQLNGSEPTIQMHT